MSFIGLITFMVLFAFIRTVRSFYLIVADIAKENVMSIKKSKKTIRYRNLATA
jgi:hypothetical protein